MTDPYVCHDHGSMATINTPQMLLASIYIRILWVYYRACGYGSQFQTWGTREKILSSKCKQILPECGRFFEVSSNIQVHIFGVKVAC